MRLQQSSKQSADWNNTVTASGFRRAELTIRISLGDFDCAAKQIHTLPAKSEYLADPQPCKHGKLNVCTKWLRQFWREPAYQAGE